MDPLRVDLCRLTRRLDPDDVRLLLGARVVADADRMDAVRAALEELGYQPVAGGEYYQWSRDLDVEGDTASRVRIDLLGQIPDDRSGVKITERRIRPHDFEGLHAHPVAEAAFIHEKTIPLDVCREPPSGEVSDLRARHENHEVVRRGRRLVRSLFSDHEAVGSLRLREHIQRADIDVSVPIRHGQPPASPRLRSRVPNPRPTDQRPRRGSTETVSLRLAGSERWERRESPARRSPGRRP